MEIKDIKLRFRHIDLDNYPQLQGLGRDEIYNGKMGPGGLFLASQMSLRIPTQLHQNMRIMDLGCGRGSTSIFLARAYNALVYAIDLWITANDLFDAVRIAGCEDRVLPFNLDATKDLPFPDNYFDAIFCMDAFHYFGADYGFLDHISKYLKSGGYVVVGNPCFDREVKAPLPQVYKAFWPNEFSNYHSPQWWNNLFRESGLFTELVTREAQDGVLLWEDALLHDIAVGNDRDGRIKADADEIVFGHDNPDFPYLTHYILSCRKSAAMS
jgi:cyclopropane fatty-acyl-phospholipid synthase-like methyltransferase